MSILGKVGSLLPQRLAWSLRRLRASRKRNISQIGQDFWVAGEVFNKKRNGYFVEIGSANGYDINNTLILETRYGWNGICVEANPDVFETLRLSRRVSCVNTCVDGEPGTVEFRKDGLFGGILGPAIADTMQSKGEIVSLPAVTLVDLLEKYGAPREIDYLSIDIEGAEERVLLGFDYSKYVFRCMTIERPSDRLRQVLLDNGYRLVRDMPGLDASFVHASFVDEYIRNAYAFWADAT